jgi:hypothetical protein
MEARLKFFVLVLAIAATSVSGQDAPPAQGGHAATRAAKYYAALDSGDFGTAWLFFGSRMRADTPRDQYVSEARRILVRVRPVDTPTLVWVGHTGTQQRPLAKVRTKLLFVTKDGKDVTSTHVTEWVWQRSAESGQDDWFLAGETVTGETTSVFPAP